MNGWMDGWMDGNNLLISVEDKMAAGVFGTLEIMCKTAPLWLISKSAICQLHLRDCYDYCDKYMTTA